MLTILLPPSEGKAAGGDGPGWSPELGRFGAELARPRLRVANVLRRRSGGNAKLLGATGATLERARQANRSLIGAPTRPAAERFSGVVWEHLDVGSLSPGATRRARRSVVVVSAVAGLSAIDDPLPDFRLKLSAGLDPLGKLSTWWRPQLSAVLNQALEGQVVIDLLPQEHAAAWTPQPDRYDLRRVRMLDRQSRPIGHNAKAAKGLLARQLLEAGDADADAVLREWRHPELRLEVEAGGASGRWTP